MGFLMRLAQPACMKLLTQLGSYYHRWKKMNLNISSNEHDCNLSLQPAFLLSLIAQGFSLCILVIVGLDCRLFHLWFSYAWHVPHGAYAVYTPWCICGVFTYTVIYVWCLYQWVYATYALWNMCSVCVTCTWHPPRSICNVDFMKDM